MYRKYFIPTIILIGTIYCNIANYDWFPFSNYPMYSKLFLPGVNFQIYDFSVVEASGEEHEIETRKYLYPFWTASFSEALFYNKKNDVLQKKLNAAFKLYKYRQEKDGKPPIVALRVYSKNFIWKKLVEAKLKSENPSRPNPESAELVYEIK